MASLYTLALHTSGQVTADFEMVFGFPGPLLSSQSLDLLQGGFQGGRRVQNLTV